MQCRLCHHTKLDGLRCRAVALRGQDFCFAHNRYHGKAKQGHQAAAHRYADFRLMDFLELEAAVDHASIRRATAQVLRAVASNRISIKRATLLLDGLDIASRNLTAEAAPKSGSSLA